MSNAGFAQELPDLPERLSALADQWSKSEAQDSSATRSLSAEEIEELAPILASETIADAVTLALHEDGRTLRELSQACGIGADQISRAANGKPMTVISLMRLALGMGKRLKLTIE